MRTITARIVAAVSAIFAEAVLSPEPENDGEPRSSRTSSGKMRFRSIRPKDRLGRKGEKAAIAFLERKGYRILEQNLRLDPFGELDLVAEDGECLVFIEVKTRKSDADGGAVEAVGMKKRRSLHRLAMAYMNRRNRPECPMRFDVVAITWPEKAAPRIDHYRDAFDIPPPLKTDNK